MKKYISAAAIVLSILAGSSAHAATYKVDRQIGTGSITGFIETNGKVGRLGGDDILDWEFSFASPNLSPTSDGKITFAESTRRGTQVIGSASSVIATETELSFEFVDSWYSFLIFQNSASAEVWCIGKGCYDQDIAEYLNPGINYTRAEKVLKSGTEVFATANAVVPLPAGAPLLLTGIAGFAWLRRRKAKKA
ncbi:VPLPA-CTERM sorting domain-containing protein [Lutimaribacter saemankumensis]|uniref:VPLPA-CTERM protein sorting domain-containing protein n=1 Tax=Lutimaribacter saemankumensis TaxID=490829 RepID=A0A1G8TC95_9RHOB|nr:VPLPA-CTERM sorting domain-containing protein [Lutimaribacter saemankumensis]SDJ39212.1 VPLPA-CTERM protein sorting domain-containing protein [Lutimaribacter saemankumensis]